MVVKPGRGFKSFNTASRTIKGYETMHMLKKGQVKKVEKGAVRERIKFIAKIFGPLHNQCLLQGGVCPQQLFATQPFYLPKVTEERSDAFYSEVVRRTGVDFYAQLAQHSLYLTENSISCVQHLHHRLQVIRLQ